MSNYAIAIGGSGARCLESLVHLCAAGLGPEKLFLLIIDPDDAHGNIETLRDVITKYRACREQLRLTHDSPIFRTQLEFSIEDSKEFLAWSPVFGEKNLRQYFQYDLLASAPAGSEKQMLGDMIRLLYSKAELDLEWDQGFRGRSSVGAPVMARIKEHLKERPWFDLLQSMKTSLGEGREARIFVMASIFGATGASGFPTVAQILRDESQGWPNKYQLFLGGNLLLPYFSFKVPPNQTGLYASPDNFLISTKAALKHYSFFWREVSPYDAMYFIGDQALDPEGKEFALGGKKQKNSFHYIELISALSAIDFYERKLGDKEKLAQTGVAAAQNQEEEKANRLSFYCGRSQKNIIDWGDLPGADIKNQLLFFTTFVYAYRVFYFPLLRDANFEKSARLAPWYVDHFSKARLSLVNDRAKDEQDHLINYVRTYLEWLVQIHSSSSWALRLMNFSALRSSRRKDSEGQVDFPELTDAQFRTLLFSDINDAAFRYEPKLLFGFDEVWERLCSIQPAEIAQLESPTARFAYMLFKSSKAFCEQNYALNGDGR